MLTDIAVVGAGAAGLIASIMARRAEPDKKVVLFDAREKIGTKILISGGTRCNVTNRRVQPGDYQGGTAHYIKHVLEAFTPAQTILFFEQLGVELVLEPSGKYFPSTNSGKTVLEALLRELTQAGVQLKAGIKIEQIKSNSGSFLLKTSEGEYKAKRVILATGGLSYPQTGSDGTGLAIAAELGHSIVFTTPALTPLLSADEQWTSLSGVSLESAVSFYRCGKKEASATGALLFTHFGFSGPAALDISRHVARCSAADRPEVFADFIPGFDDESVIVAFQKNSRSNLSLKHFLTDQFGLPVRFVEVFMTKNALDPMAVASRLSRSDRNKLVQLLRRSPLAVTGVIGYKKAEVTAGGIDLKEVMVATMGSRIEPGLFFAGEILDADGRIGGFNFQWAWSTGAIAGKAAAESLRP